MEVGRRAFLLRGKYLLPRGRGGAARREDGVDGRPGRARRARDGVFVDPDARDPLLRARLLALVLEAVVEGPVRGRGEEDAGVAALRLDVDAEAVEGRPPAGPFFDVVEVDEERRERLA